MVHLESLVTQMTFERALRMRITVNASGSAQDVPKKNPGTKDLAGRLNTLVTADMQNIMAGGQVIYMTTYIPVQIAVSVWFLYAVLGWRLEFISLAQIILSNHLQLVSWSGHHCSNFPHSRQDS
jgi:hypothetical protein